MRYGTLLGVAAVLLIGLVSGAPADAAQAVPAVRVVPAAAVATSITVDGAQGGRVFGGIGAISGGGGNSRLLPDYPEPYRSQILDYLFKPGYGASLQILKVEIGGDANSTDGSEASIEHSKGSIDCSSGYEWWLMEQAKARNPRIKLYGLAWGAPGWIGNGNFWSSDMISYLIAWLGCARSHGLTINYLGGWNENGYVPSWYVQLRQALDQNGYAGTQLVAADDADWSVAGDLAANQAFDNAVSVVGVHYPCGGDGSAAGTCSTTQTALNLGKPLWASENGSQDYNAGAAAMIRSIIRGYVDAKMTAYINWPLVAAIPAGLPFETTGLMVDDQPWSGSYATGQQLWVAAQVTQFAQPGWSFIDSASGFLGGDRSNGSYVTLKSPGGRAYSTLIETTTATAAQTVNISVTGGLPKGLVHVWATDLNSANPVDNFMRLADITPVNGRYSLTVQPGYVYSLTTTTGQHKGAAQSPPAAAFGLPYHAAISQQASHIGSEPAYLSDQDGAFEVQPCLGGRTGNCLQQMAPAVPIEWHQHAGTPYTIFGDNSWTNYTVSAGVLLTQPGSAEVLGRFEGRDYYQIGHADAYYLRADDQGNWSILKGDTSGDLTALASGTVNPLGLNIWHTLALTFDGSTITAAIDGTMVGSAADSSYPTGEAGLGVGVGDQAANAGADLLTQPTGNLGWSGPYLLGTGQVAGTVAPTTAPGGNASGAGPVTGIGGMCLDDTSGSTSAGNPVELNTCDSGSSQTITATAAGELDVLGGCVAEPSTTKGSAVEFEPCDGTSAQVWTPQPDGTLLNAGSGLCLDDPGFNTAPGTNLDVWTCNAGSNQIWTLPASNSAIGWQQSSAQANTWIQFQPQVTAGNSYATSITVQGTGDVYLDFYNGASDVTSQAVQLSSTPQTLWVQTQVVGGNTPVIQVRTASAGPVNLIASAARLYQQAGDLGWQTGQFANLSVSPAGTASYPGPGYELVNRATGDVIGAAGDSSSAGTPLIASPFSSGASQQWHLEADGDAPGSVSLVNATSGLAVAASGSGQLQQLPAAQGPGQLWRLVPDRSGGYYTVVSNGQLVAEDGPQVVLAPARRPVSAAGQWQLKPVPAADLAASFDNTGITDDANPAPAPGFIGFDGEGTSYSAQGLAADGLTPGTAVTVDGTALTWPGVPAGQPDNTMATGQAITLHGSGSKLTFLAAANNSAMSGSGTVYYTDGTTSSFTLDIGNFWFPAGQSGNPGNIQVAAVNYANYPSGSSGHTVYLFGESVPIISGKTVAEVVLPALSSVTGYNSALHIFAMGIGG